MVKKLKLAVLGTPIAHSRSPKLQASFAGDCGIGNFSYERIETDRNSLKATVGRLRAEGYDGFNCTMPLKTDMAALADVLTDEARILQSVNTVSIRDGKFHCDTTDGMGILLTVRRGLGNMNTSPTEAIMGKNAVLLGAGGAARSAALSLKNAGAQLTVLNRTLEGAYALDAMLGGGCRCLPLADEPSLCMAAAECDILINCTSLGMKDSAEFKSLSFVAALPAHALVIDAVYNPLETALLRIAEARGIRTMSGLWMLVYQGAAAFEKWSGVLPDEHACSRAFDAIK